MRHAYDLYLQIVGRGDWPYVGNLCRWNFVCSTSVEGCRLGFLLSLEGGRSVEVCRGKDSLAFGRFLCGCDWMSR